MVREKARFLVYQATFTRVEESQKGNPHKKSRLEAAPSEGLLEKAFLQRLSLLYGDFGVANVGRFRVFLLNKGTVFVLRVRRLGEDDAARVIAAWTDVDGYRASFTSLHVAGSVSQLKRALRRKKIIVNEGEIALL